MNFKTGLPDKQRPIVTPFGLCTFVRMADEEHVYLYMGGNRTFKVPDSTSWRYA